MEAGLGDPFIASWPVLESVVRGAKRKEAESGRQVKRRLPMTPGLMRIIRKYWEREATNYELIMLWGHAVCAILVLRSGEVTLTSMREYDAEVHLSEGDVAVDST